MTRTFNLCSRALRRRPLEHSTWHAGSEARSSSIQHRHPPRVHPVPILLRHFVRRLQLVHGQAVDPDPLRAFAVAVRLAWSEAKPRCVVEGGRELDIPLNPQQVRRSGP